MLASSVRATHQASQAALASSSSALNAVNLSLVGFSQGFGDVHGQILVFFVMSVAAAEAAVGLAIVIAMFRNTMTLNIDEINLFRG